MYTRSYIFKSCRVMLNDAGAVAIDIGTPHTTYLLIYLPSIPKECAGQVL